MPKLVKPTTKNSPKVTVGKNPNNKPAEAYDKRGTDYKLKEAKGTEVVDSLNPSAGNVSKGNYAPINKNGEVKIRGTGAATKGVMSRGPMA